MGVDQRTITADKAMLDKTSWALARIPNDPSNLNGDVAKNDIEDPGTRLGVATEPGWGTTWESDGDFRTQHFSQKYSRLLYSLFWADQRIFWEQNTTATSVEKMAANYAATEAENERAVFDVQLPPKLTD
jgi:hypothetical protein